jgi:hypothetical protein
VRRLDEIQVTVADLGCVARRSTTCSSLTGHTTVEDDDEPESGHTRRGGQLDEHDHHQPAPARSPPTPAARCRTLRGAAFADSGVIAESQHQESAARTPQLIVFSVVQTVMFLLLFRYVFGGSIHIPTMSYINYLVPGFLAQIAIFDGFGINRDGEDSKSGLIDRFRALRWRARRCRRAR